MERAEEVLRHLRRKFKIGLITNGRTSIQHGKINRLGLRDYFDAIFDSEEAGCKKPDPEIFRMALDKLGINAEEAVFIGDHPDLDMAGAANTGMHTIWMKVNQPWPDGLEFTPSFTIHALDELIQEVSMLREEVKNLNKGKQVDERI